MARGASGLATCTLHHSAAPTQGHAHLRALQDLREAFLQDFGGGKDRRDKRAAAFDARLHHVAERALRMAT